MPPLMQIEESGPARERAGFALWNLGFRPFYLLASVFAALSVLLWAAQYTGLLALPYLAAPVWHAHEMLFGYTLAVITGFLFTAVRNWTALPTPHGAALAALAGLWVLGRVLVLTRYRWAAAVVNTAFPLAVAAAIAVPLIRSGNRRNFFLIGLLVLLAGAVLATHLVQLGVVDGPPWAGIRAGLDVVLIVIAVIAGRVVPMFTANAIARARVRRYAWLDRACVGSVALLLAADVTGVRGVLLEAVLAAAALLHLARWWLWDPAATLRTPLVWVLHAGYAWIPLHLVLRIFVEHALVASPLATHALTVGAIGGLTIGMMTRTARGHTGRLLQADEFEVASYVLVLLAAVVRVFLPLAVGGMYLASIALSGLFWSAGFALYAVRYWPILTRPRIDGRPG